MDSVKSIHLFPVTAIAEFTIAATAIITITATSNWQLRVRLNSKDLLDWAIIIATIAVRMRPKLKIQLKFKKMIKDHFKVFQDVSAL